MFSLQRKILEHSLAHARNEKRGKLNPARNYFHFVPWTMFAKHMLSSTPLSVEWMLCPVPMLPRGCGLLYPARLLTTSLNKSWMECPEAMVFQFPAPYQLLASKASSTGMTVDNGLRNLISSPCFLFV